MRHLIEGRDITSLSSYFIATVTLVVIVISIQPTGDSLMHISLATFIQLLLAHADEPGDVRSFLDECLPFPTSKEQALVRSMLNPRLPMTLYVSYSAKDGWVI